MLSRVFTPKMSFFTFVAIVDFFLLIGYCLLYMDEPPFFQDDRAVELLIWTHPFGHYTELPDCLALYQIAGCTVSDDRRTFQQADAVIFHHRDIVSGTPLPTEPRPHGQKWIWMNHESPAHTYGLRSFEGVFNLTLTYRRDSNIFIPYGYLVTRKHTRNGVLSRTTHPLHVPSPSHLLRPHFLAWVISNWSESQARVAFYYQLKEYLRVDVFGNAGQPLTNGTVMDLVSQYQFYLALENSQHTDYITEKVWNAVLAGAIPVVLGPSRKDYENFLPSEAFIHVDDFHTVRDLARYLLKLRANPELLRRHLDWRADYSLHKPTFWAEHYCIACEAVRRTMGRTDVVTGLADWFLS